MKKFSLFLCSLLAASAPLLFAADDSYQYDTGDDETMTEEESGEETPSSEESDSAVKGFAKGIKQVAYEGPKDLVKETAEEVPKKPSLNKMVEGVNRGTQKFLDHTVKGAYKVATLGQGELESYEVQEPEKGSGEPTKIKISIPGT